MANAGTSLPKTNKCPVKGQRNILITSALPYVNNVPHLGNIIGCVLSADVYSRYCRLRGYNSLYVCGTDEYGTATETKALQEGVTPREICDKYHALHTEIYEWFDIAFDHWGRTSTTRQTEIAQDIFLKCKQHGHIKEDGVEQTYCETCERFLADRFIEGTCPHCNYDDARGDQCDACGKLLNANDLIRPRCKVCHTAGRTSTVSNRSSRHLFLDLPSIEPSLRDYISRASHVWSSNSVCITNNWLKDGLKPRCITRDLKWGTPVPVEEFKEKVFYVWFDAPIGYISITAGYTDEWQKWWKDAENAGKEDAVELVQFMGKDNVPFHTVVFPSTLLGAKDNYTMLNRLSTTEYLNYEDGKFSKSRGVGVFGNDAKSTGIPVEVWRYYLLVNRPETSDSVFAWDDFAAKNNNELLPNLGNLIHRSLTFISSRFGGKLPARGQLEKEDHDFLETINKHIRSYFEALEDISLKEGLKIAMDMSHVANKYLQDSKAWELFESDRARCGTVISVCANFVVVLASHLQPYLGSQFTDKISKQMGLSPDMLRLDPEFTFRLPDGHAIGKPKPLFSLISDDQCKEMRNRFVGKQDDAEETISDTGFPVNMRVGVVLDVQPHPEEDKTKLWVLQVDMGSAVGTRQVVAGLREFYPNKEDLLHRKVVVVLNLSPAKLGGVTSEGMALCAVKKPKGEEPKMVLLEVSDAEVGTAVGAKGMPTELMRRPLTLKEFQKLKLQVGTDEDACYKKKSNFALYAGEFPVRAPGVEKNSKIK